MTNWFEVNREGLAQLVERHGKHRIITELIANAWDEEGVTEVIVDLRPKPGRAEVELYVTDNSSNGFRDLSHAWTLYAPSDKKRLPEARGRFNLGEKLVIAMCSKAHVISTTGTVVFDRNGRHEHKTKSDRGTEFYGLMRMTRDELLSTVYELKRLQPPKSIKTTIRTFDIDGRETDCHVISSVEPLAVIPAELRTVCADAEGYMRDVLRTTSIELRACANSEEGGWLYELGVPVVDIGGPWDVNVLQKVPLNKDRDNVRPAYLRTLRTFVLDGGHKLLSSPQSHEEWVTEGLARADPSTVSEVLDLRFGKKRVSFDPSDPEANKRAVAEGYTVVAGGSLPGDVWRNVRESDAMKPAGKVTPTKHPKFSPDGVDTEVPFERWTDAQKVVCASFKLIGQAMLHDRTGLTIRIVCDKWNRFSAWYGEGGFLTLNVQVLGHQWFEDGAGGLQAKHLGLLLHELGHEFCADHLSEDYHDALTRLGGELALLVADDLKFRKLVSRKVAV